MILDGNASVSREIAKAVAIAGLSALATKLAEWGVEALKELRSAARGAK